MTDKTIADLANALQVADPTDATQVAAAEVRAGAMLHMALAFIQARVGKDEASRLVRDAFDDVTRSMDPSPSDQPAAPSPVTPTVPTLYPEPRRAPPPTVQGRAETMLDFLERWPSADADREARAAIWGAATYLHRHSGEEKTAEYLRFVMAQMSRVVWFEQLPVASLARH